MAYERGMAREIDRKLRLTATLLGIVTRKDLAAAFRRINPKTTFDVGRADKWLQGRARPRESEVYEDWAKVLDLNRPGRWIADCEINEFIDEIAQRHGRERAELLEALNAPREGRSAPGPGISLTGIFACYSHAWSPYFRGRLIRGELSIGAALGTNHLPVTYAEELPTGRLQLEGRLSVDKRALRLEVRDRTDTQFLNICLFPPSPPASVLCGMMFGTTLIGPDAQPSVTRLAMVRLPQTSLPLKTAEAYLDPAASLAEDLRSLGLDIEDPAAVDAGLAKFLTGGIAAGVDQVPVAAYRRLVDLFDRSWLSSSGRGVRA